MGRKKLKTLTKEGVRLEQLRRLAEMLAQRLDEGVEDKYLPSVAKQYRDTVREIEEITGVSSGEGDPVGKIIKEAADGVPKTVR